MPQDRSGTEPVLGLAVDKHLPTGCAQGVRLLSGRLPAPAVIVLANDRLAVSGYPSNTMVCQPAEFARLIAAALVGAGIARSSAPSPPRLIESNEDHHKNHQAHYHNV